MWSSLEPCRLVDTRSPGGAISITVTGAGPLHFVLDVNGYFR